MLISQIDSLALRAARCGVRIIRSFRDTSMKITVREGHWITVTPAGDMTLWYQFQRPGKPFGGAARKIGSATPATLDEGLRELRRLIRECDPE